MTATLGNAAFVLSANGSGLSKGLDKAKSEIQQFASIAEKKAAEVDNRLSRMGQSAGKGMASAFAGLSKIAGPAAVAAGVGLAVGGMVLKEFGDTVTTGVSKVWGDALERMKDINESGKIATAFRMSPVEWQKMVGGFMWAGNTNASEFIESQASITDITQKAVEGTPEATKAFAQLNIQVEKFAALSQDRRYWTLINALAAYSGDRVGLAGKFFGTDGAKRMMGLIGRTEEEINRLSFAYQVTAQQIAAAELSTRRWQDTTALINKEYERLLFNLGPVIAAVSAVSLDMLNQFKANFDVGNIDWGKVATEGAYAFGTLVDVSKAAVKAIGPTVLDFIDVFADAIECVYQLDQTMKIMGVNGGTVLSHLTKAAFPFQTMMLELVKNTAEMNRVTPSESPIARSMKQATAASRRFLDQMGNVNIGETAERYRRLAQAAADAYQSELQRRTQQIRNQKSVAPDVGGDGGFSEGEAAGAFGAEYAQKFAEKGAEKLQKAREKQLRELERRWHDLDRQAAHSNLGELIQRGSAGEWKLAARVDFDRAGSRAEDEQRALLKQQLDELRKLVDKEPIQLGVL